MRKRVRIGSYEISWNRTTLRDWWPFLTGCVFIIVSMIIMLVCSIMSM